MRAKGNETRAWKVELEKSLTEVVSLESSLFCISAILFGLGPPSWAPCSLSPCHPSCHPVPNAHPPVVKRAGLRSTCSSLPSSSPVKCVLVCHRPTAPSRSATALARSVPRPARLPPNVLQAHLAWVVVAQGGLGDWVGTVLSGCFTASAPQTVKSDSS